ncbi:hypothetical protein [Nocardiopsis baichengensis]|uniref:hypothetical protein n=1 Tax=Nocardiopsis baichengensis TaxID=280240 RepID=UPI00034559CA|nr:hypothetical protein [Nocardiopsis baichengensis]
MELIGVPAYQLVRSLGPPLVLLAVVAFLIRRRRPARPGLLWAAVLAHLSAAALPYGWLLLQATAGVTGTTLVGLIMTLLQPAVEFGAWLLVLGAVFLRPRRTGSPDSERAAAPGEMIIEESASQAEGRH